MPSNYTSDPTATQSPSSAPGQDVLPIARLPVDGDPANVASIYQTLKMLTDGLGWTWAHGVFKDIARTITAIWTFSQKVILNGSSGDTNPAIETDAVPTDRKALWSISGGAQPITLYS